MQIIIRKLNDINSEQILNSLFKYEISQMKVIVITKNIFFNVTFTYLFNYVN